MKKLMVVLGMLASSMSMANGQLFPVGHTMCLNAEQYCTMQACEEGKQFLVADDGRCGCLTTSDYTDADTCKVAFIVCEDAAPFTSLYQMSMVNGQIEKTYQGCGCLATDDGMHATTVN